MSYEVECECGEVVGSRLEFGVHYGYPPCCIEYYLERAALIDAGRWDHMDDTLQLSGTGFVCCPDHELWSINDLVDEIESARHCPIEFSLSVGAAIEEGFDVDWTLGSRNAEALLVKLENELGLVSA